MANFTAIDTKTGEILAVVSRMAGSLISAAQAEAQAIADATAAYRQITEVNLAAQGKGINTFRASDAVDGRFMIQETGRRFAMMVKSFVLPVATGAGESSVSAFEHRNLINTLGADAAAQMVRQMQG